MIVTTMIIIGHVELVTALLAAPGVDVNHGDNDDDTPLTLVYTNAMWC